LQKPAISSKPFSPANNCSDDPMKCRNCSEKLEVLRQCRRIRLRCTGCNKEYQIHEVASDLDEETEKILERYTVIIYD